MNKKIIIASFIVSMLYLLWGISSGQALDYILPRRMLRLVAIALVAYANAISTVYFQTITDNKLLTPSILGVDSVYLLIQMMITLLGAWLLPDTIRDVITLLVVVIIIPKFYQRLLHRLNNNILSLLLIGMILSSGIQSAVSALSMMIDPNDYQIFQSFTIASLNDIDTSRILLIGIVMMPLLTLKKRLDPLLDVMGLGKTWAQNFGVDTQKFESLAMTLIVGMTSISALLIGPNIFVSLIAISIGRLLVNKYGMATLTWTTGLVAYTLLIVSQIILERLLNFNGSLGFGLSLIGGIVFIIVFFREARS